jgi:DNA polymerase-3 subunit alpha
VATNDAHYLKREDARSHEIMLCIQTGKTMSDSSRMRWPTPEFFLKSRAEMQQAFAELEDALDRPFEIAQRCQVRLDKIQEPFPKFEVPEGHTTDTYFEYIARQGFERRRPHLEAQRAAGRLKHDLPEYAERLDREIRMVQQMKFSGYFLIVWDFIRFAKRQSRQRALRRVRHRPQPPAHPTRPPRECLIGNRAAGRRPGCRSRFTVIPPMWSLPSPGYVVPRQAGLVR